MPRTTARNEPCPCGSGRRYKDCHGSLRGAEGATVSALAMPRRYRPAGDDWRGIDESDQDRLAELMERALLEQKAGRVREAERLYRAVLNEAPRTHDALHMLGVVRLGLGDFTDAQRLIKQALALRRAYPAIERNLSIVERSLAARDRRGIETVSEHALEGLMESLRRMPAAAPAVRSASLPATNDVLRSSAVPLHVVVPASDVAGDARWLAPRLRRLLAPFRATFWNASEPLIDGNWSHFDDSRIDVASRRYPRTGLVALAGIDDEGDLWLREPLDRLLVFVQRASPSVLLERLRRIAADGRRSLTLVFDSHARASRFGKGHRVVPPAIDVAQWQSPVDNDRSRGGTLRVATCGQDRLGIHASNDSTWLLAMGAAAGRLDLFDPGPLREAVGTSTAIVCIPGDPANRAGELARCTLYLQQPLPWWAEDGRVMFGAMLSGIPVVCPRRSVYAEYLDDGSDSWLYDDRDDALRIVATLRNHPERVHAAGEAARRSAFARFQPSALEAGYRSVVGEWIHNS